MYRNGLQYVPFPLNSITHAESQRYAVSLTMNTTTPKPNDPNRKFGPLIHLFGKNREDALKADPQLQDALTYIAESFKDKAPNSSTTPAPEPGPSTSEDSGELSDTEIVDRKNKQRQDLNEQFQKKPPNEKQQATIDRLNKEADEHNKRVDAYHKRVRQDSSLEEVGSLDEDMAESSNKRPRLDDLSTSTGLGSASSGGFGQDEGPAVTVDAPFKSSPSGTLTFNQVHRMTSKGLAFNTVANGTEEVHMTTALAHIPWDRAFMYMTPRDFASLPLGSVCTDVSIKIVVRNPQIGFKTGTSVTETATLNHNKHYIVADALEDKCYGIERKYSMFTQPMKPYATAAPDISGYANIMYGYGQDNLLFDSTVPASLMGVDIELINYFTLVSYNNAYYVANPTAEAPGWGNFIEHLNEKNLQVAVGTTILERSHKFINAPLTKQLPGVHNQTHHSFTLGGSAMNRYRQLTSLTNLPFKNPGATGTLSDDTTAAPIQVTNKALQYHIATYDSVLEQGMLNATLLGHPGDIKHQPSIHVGMKPIPKISGVVVNGQPSEWTTVNAFYEVTCTMNVSYGLPNTFTHGTGYAIHEGGVRTGNNTVQDPNLMHRFGHIQLATTI